MAMPTTQIDGLLHVIFEILASNMWILFTKYTFFSYIEFKGAWPIPTTTSRSRPPTCTALVPIGVRAGNTSDNSSLLYPSCLLASTAQGLLAKNRPIRVVARN